MGEEGLNWWAMEYTRVGRVLLAEEAHSHLLSHLISLAWISAELDICCDAPDSNLMLTRTRQRGTIRAGGSSEAAEHGLEE